MKKVISYNEPMAYFELATFMKNYIYKDTIIICIGTDKCIGDCLGPVVGTLLSEKNFPLPVYGTLDHPIHALNIEKAMDYIFSYGHVKRKHIIGIDAALGNNDNIGEIHAGDYPIHPGLAIRKILPDVGTESISGIVDSSDNKPNIIRLSFVRNMARVITYSLMEAYTMRILGM